MSLINWFDLLHGGFKNGPRFGRLAAFEEEIGG